MIKRIWQFVFNNSLLLILGAAAAMLWANIDFAGYQGMVALPLFANPHFGVLLNGRGVLDLHYLVNDVLMALFFVVAGREAWIAMNCSAATCTRSAARAVPVLCRVGGMEAGGGFYVLGALWLDTRANWAADGPIPTATDIAFSYLVARMIFGRGTRR